MKYSFLENNKRNILKKHLFEYDQFADDDEYDDEPEDIDPEVAKLIDYKLKNVNELNDKLSDSNISLEEKELYIKINKNLLNEKNKYGYTALSEACRVNHLELVELLLENGADVNKKNYGNTALMIACRNNYIKIVELLLKHDADINIKDGDGYTALISACMFNKQELVDLLLKHGADVNVKDNYGDTALLIACSNKNLELVELLLAHGADINEKNNNGYTALMRACTKNNQKIVELLLAHGVDVNEKNKYGDTALLIACSNKNLELVELLLAHGADVNVKDNYGNTTLLIACRGNSIDIVKLLLDHGVDPNIGDSQGKTALWQACYNVNFDIVKLLLEYGAVPRDLNISSDSGNIILINACKKDDFDIAKFLLENGADPNDINRNMETALLYACKNNNLELVKLLLEHGADICCYLIDENLEHYINYNDMLDSILQLSSKSTIQKSCYEFCNYLINKSSYSLYKKLYTLEALLDYGARISPYIFYHLVIKAFDIYTDHSYSDYYSLSNYSGLFKKILDDINISEISISKKGDKAIGSFIETLIHENLVGNFNYIKELLNLMSNIDVNLPSDETLLTYALRFSNLSYGYELVKLLLKHGADPNKKNKKGFTPLGVALKFGNNKIIKLLSKDGIDTNNLTGQYALISALRSENYKLAKQLIKDNIDINVEYSDRYQSRLSPFSIILRISEDKIRLPLLKLIIEHGLDVNSRDILVSITRSKLAQKDKESIIRLLLKKGADINKSNCLKFSLFDKDIELFNFLLKNGANINRTDSDGDTILLEVVRDKYNTRFDDNTVKLLLKHKIDVNKRNNKLETALYWSITNNNNDYTKLLLEHGADPNIHIMKGDTVLHLAVRNKDIGLIKLLLEYDADPNIKNNSGKSPLDIAKTKEIKNILLKKD